MANIIYLPDALPMPVIVRTTATAAETAKPTAAILNNFRGDWR